jgi:uncharacterized protein (TIGR02246 family)
MPESPEQLHRVFQGAFNRHDFESIAALYEPDAVLATAGAPVVGRNAIREHYRGVLASRSSIELRTLQVHRAGNLAMLHGTWILQETHPDGTTVRREGRNTETAREQPGGAWLFVIDNPRVPPD